MHYTSKRTGRRRTRRMRANDARRGWDRRKGRRIRRNPVAAERRRRSHRRRKNPVAAERRHHRRRRNPIANPISGLMEFIGGIAGVGAGFGLASFADRMAITHAYSGSPLADVPAQGAIYNSEALLGPIWMSPARLGYATAAIVAPLALAHFVNRHQGFKAFLQLMGFGALGRTAGKAFDDAVAKFGSGNAKVQQFYAGELAASGKLAAANVNALPSAPPATFAGVPGASAPRVLAAAPERVSAVGAFTSAPGFAPQGAPIASAPQARQGMAGQPVAGNPFDALLNNPDGRD